MVLGLLLARAGVEVTVLEKHEDFLHDFRGDTVHPATLQLVDDLGLGERFARLPQTRITDVVLPDGAGGLRADLTVACTGRNSVLPAVAGLGVTEFAVPFDTWWFRLSRRDGEQVGELTRRPGRGRFAIVIPREGYFQIGYVARKGTDGRLRARGIDAFRRDVAELLPEYADRVGELVSMDDVKLLDVRLTRLRRWHAEGSLCLGDAAHARSPVGGVGINLAVQDAVATATLLAGRLRRGAVRGADLARVRRRRLPSLLMVQALQRIMHADLAGPLGSGRQAGPAGRFMTAAQWVPGLRTPAVYLVGVGLRLERAPAAAREACRGHLSDA